MADWKFYGRREQLADLERMLNRERWFFAKVSGRRRIGKTTLIQKAMQEIGSKQPVFYVQVPDSEPAGILSAVKWTHQYVGISPVLDAEQRAILTSHDIIPQDLNDLTRDANLS
ncbi:MAG: hypothetical protein ABSG53_05025 [Thermoguttaceae bacterium]